MTADGGCLNLYRIYYPLLDRKVQLPFAIRKQILALFTHQANGLINLLFLFLYGALSNTNRSH